MVATALLVSGEGYGWVIGYMIFMALFSATSAWRLRDAKME